MLSKSQIAAELEERGVGRKNQLNAVLTALADIAQEEIEAGEGFTLPGVVKVDFAYTSPRTKGSEYKKGDIYVGFGGEEKVAEADSKERKASVRLVAKPAAPLKRIVPKANDRKGQTRFLSTRAGKNVVARKAK